MILLYIILFLLNIEKKFKFVFYIDTIKICIVKIKIMWWRDRRERSVTLVQGYELWVTSCLQCKYDISSRHVVYQYDNCYGK